MLDLPHSSCVWACFWQRSPSAIPRKPLRKSKEIQRNSQSLYGGESSEAIVTVFMIRSLQFLFFIVFSFIVLDGNPTIEIPYC